MSYASTQAELDPPAVTVEPSEGAPVKRIRSEDLRNLGDHLDKLFRQYVSDRRIAELKWLRNLRQYLGIYDPEIEKDLSAQRSKAYPRITRVKCISVLSRIMNLMFPGNEKNWELRASPNPEMDPADVQQAVQDSMRRAQELGVQPEMTEQFVQDAVQRLADQRAADLTNIIDDQLQELGGDQTADYVALSRKAAASGILYGIGVLRGPYVRTAKTSTWVMDPQTRTFAPRQTDSFKPMFEFLPIWDFYPDFSAKTFATMDGYFTRTVMSRAQLRKLADREDFFGDQIKRYLQTRSQGNYRAQPFETELRAMGVRVNVNEMKSETSKYEVITWNGPISGQFLQLAGVDVPQDNLADDIEAEVWMVDGNVIKADINPWRKLGVDMKSVHVFLFDEDDTSPVGNGLPNVIRDSQMSVSAAARMLLDNASVVAGPNLELNTDLLRPDQDLASVSAYKLWYREGSGVDAQQPAVRNIQIDAHMDDLLKVVDLFMRFADAETFVGPATGGDMSRQSSEPMRSPVGAAMLRGDAALPFKDIVRNFDALTQSVIQSLVTFNRKFNPSKALEGDYDVIARGATSLIAKEIRGMQVDQLAATLTPEEKVHVDERKLVEARFAVRDMTGFLVPPDEAKARKAQAEQAQQAQMAQAQQMTEAQVRKTLSEAFKNIAQGQKNSAAADANAVQTVLAVLEKALNGGEDGSAAGNGAGEGSAGAQGQSGAQDGAAVAGV